MYDPTDPESVEREAAYREAIAAGRVAAWQRTAADPCGQIVLAEILAWSGLLDPSYVPGSFDQTAFNEGKKALGRVIHTKLLVLSSELLPDIEARLRENLASVGNGSTISE